jgi:hypothetical protein
VDPLKPFSNLIRSAWERTAKRPEAAGNAPALNNRDAIRFNAPLQAPPDSLQSRVRARIAQQSPWNAANAREVFVETVLLSELGDDLAKDPSFADIVKKVSQQLASDGKLTARLDQLLRQLVSAPPA